MRAVITMGKSSSFLFLALEQAHEFPAVFCLTHDLYYRDGLPFTATLHNLHPGLIWQSGLTIVITIAVRTYINLKCAVCCSLGAWIFFFLFFSLSNAKLNCLAVGLDSTCAKSRLAARL